MVKIRCLKCGERNDIADKECFYCDQNLTSAKRIKEMVKKDSPFYSLGRTVLKSPAPTDDSEKTTQWIGGGAILLIIIFLGIGYYSGENSDKVNAREFQLEEQIEELQSEVSDLEGDLSTSQSKLDEANSNIRNAKVFTWSNYEFMGDALEELNEVD
jgi:uncharacterized protein HemX